jgi:glutathionylspermidine synthase
MAWHTAKGDYWNESAYYSFSMGEVEILEAATNELHRLCLTAVQHVIDEKRYGELRIPAAAIPLIEATWEEEPPSLYGRFDLAYDGVSAPRLLEYNADTPTSLVEAALAQWYWLQELHPNADQFNSLHERLIACWTALRPSLQSDTVHFASMDDVEDAMTVNYIRDTAQQAGLNTKALLVSDIGLTPDGYFTDPDDQVIESCFKLYPWEWLMREDYAEALCRIGSGMQWIEPAWKQVLSNKGILPILWELYPDHPNLLPASFDVVDTVLMEAFVKKPILSREGAGVTVTMFDQNLAETPAQGYGDDGYVYQGLAVVPQFDGYRPVIGSWIIGEEAGGMGIREDRSLVTGNLSRFVPHLIEG